MKNRFEQLIEYVINDEEQKARELFHQIVVEKSREIYENLMKEDDAMGRMDQYDEGRHSMGGDQADDLIDDVSVDEQGLSEEDDLADMEDMEDMEDTEGMKMPMDMGNEEDIDTETVSNGDNETLKLDILSDIEELLDQYLSGQGQSNKEVVDAEFETEGMKMPMGEAINLKAAPKAVTSEEGSVNKHSTVAANSGARGAMAHPVKMTGDTAQGRPAPTTKDLITNVQNAPARTTVKQEAAPKPHLAQATGVNTKTPFPKQ